MDMHTTAPVYGPFHAEDLRKACKRNDATVKFIRPASAIIECPEASVPAMTVDGKYLEIVHGNAMSFLISSVA